MKVVVRAAHLASPGVIAALRSAGYRRRADPRDEYDRTTWVLALALAPLGRRRSLSLGLVALCLQQRASRLPGGALLLTAGSATAEELIWRGPPAARSGSARALAILGFAFLHRREGPAAVRYHVLTGLAFDEAARRYGVAVAAGLHTLHNAVVRYRQRTPRQVVGPRASGVVAARPWPAVEHTRRQESHG